MASGRFRLLFVKPAGLKTLRLGDECFQFSEEFFFPGFGWHGAKFAREIWRRQFRVHRRLNCFRPVRDKLAPALFSGNIIGRIV
jgi:hypothetical protein